MGRGSFAFPLPTSAEPRCAYGEAGQLQCNRRGWGLKINLDGFRNRIIARDRGVQGVTSSNQGIRLGEVPHRFADPPGGVDQILRASRARLTKSFVTTAPQSHAAASKARSCRARGLGGEAAERPPRASTAYLMRWAIGRLDCYYSVSMPSTSSSASVSASPATWRPTSRGPGQARHLDAHRS